MTTNAELVAEYNRLARAAGLRPVARFSSRAAGLRRIEALRPRSWVERTGYGKTAATEPKHARNLTAAQRRAFHSEVARVYRSGGTEAVMARWPDVSKRILAGHLRIVKVYA